MLYINILQIRYILLFDVADYDVSDNNVHSHYIVYKPLNYSFSSRNNTEQSVLTSWIIFFSIIYWYKKMEQKDTQFE